MDVPESAKLWLTEDNARFLHEFADEHFAGDREKALNGLVTWAKRMLSEPTDPWSALTALKDSRLRAKRLPDAGGGGDED